MSETRDSACPLDCPDTCSVTVTVGAGRLIAVDATPVDRAANPFTQGFICQKVRHHAERVYGPDRVLTPMIRVGPKGSGRFRAASWSEATAIIAERITATAAEDPASIVPYLYSSSAGALGSATTGYRFWARLGASQVPHTICAETATAAWRSVVGRAVLGDPLDVPDARAIIVWGANPSVSNTHLPPLINTAVKGDRDHRGGATLVVVDPRRTPIAKRAALHLAPRPGTDVVLAMAVARRLHEIGGVDQDFVERHTTGSDDFLAACDAWTPDRAAAECGVDETLIDALAQLLATVSPCFLRVGWGIERNRNGGNAIRAVLGMRLLAGRFGARGAGLLGSTSAANPVPGEALIGSFEPKARREVNMNRLGAMLSDTSVDPPIRLLFVQGANPAVMNPNQRAVLAGLRREDVFTVVHDQVLTDTARFADVVLPATTHYEVPDLATSYGTLTVQRMEAVIDRVGESRTNNEVYRSLAEVLGWDDAATFDPAVDVALGGLDDQLGTGTIPGREPGRAVAFETVFPGLPGARARFHATRYNPVDAGDDSLPLALVTPANAKTINSIFGERGDLHPVVSLHPDDAAARGIGGGEQVRVHNGWGSIVLPAKVDPDLRPGLVHVPKGAWSRSYSGENGGLTVNALMPDSLSDLAGGACFNDARVEVELVGAAPVSPGTR